MLALAEVLQWRPSMPLFALLALVVTADSPQPDEARKRAIRACIDRLHLPPPDPKTGPTERDRRALAECLEQEARAKKASK